MMRYLLAALAALILTSPAAAVEYAKLAVMRPTTYKANGLPPAVSERVFRGMMATAGVDWFWMPAAAITEDVRNGHAVYNRGLASQSVVQGDAVWFFEYWRAGWGISSGLYPDSTLKAQRWTKVPTVRLNTRSFGSGIFEGGDCATCSTGTVDAGGGGHVLPSRAQYEVGSDLMFRVSTTNRHFQQALVGDGRYRRVRIGVGAANHGDANCRDCVIRQANGDSASMWELYPPNVDGTTPAKAFGNDVRHVPQIMVFSDAGSAEGAPMMDWLVLNRLDSLIFARTGKRLIRNPLALAIIIDDASGTGSATASPNITDTARVAFVVNDSSNFRRIFVDSCNALRAATGLKVPMGLGIPPDSFRVHPVSRMLDEVPADSWKAFPQIWRGVLDHSSAATNPLGVAGNTSRSQVNDLFGSKRLHRLIPIGATSLTPDCTDNADSSFTCKLAWAIQDLRAVLTEKGLPQNLSTVVAPPRDDWSNRTIHRGSLGQRDSVLAIAYLRGIRGFRVGVMSASNDGYHEWDFGPAHGWSSINRTVPVRAEPGVAGSRVIGRMKMLPSRGSEYTANQAHYFVGHELVDEFLTGLFTGGWYMPHSMMYVNMHQMQSRTMVMEIDAGTLCGTGTPHWYTIKWIANWLAIGNRFAGRTTGDIVFADDLELRGR